MKRKKIVCILLILSLLISDFSGIINIWSAGTQDYRAVVFEDDKNADVQKPTAQFSLTYNSTKYESPVGIDIDSFAMVVNATVGDTVTVQDMSRSNRGKVLKSWDFQYTRPDGNNEFIKDKSFEKSYTLDKAGTYTFSLNVRDTVENEAWTFYWGNWSDNGNHQVIGNNPGKNLSDPSDDFNGYWYFSRIVVIVSEKSYTLQEKHIDTNTGTVLDETLYKDIVDDSFTTSAQIFSDYDFVGSRAGYTWNEIANGTTENISSRTANFDSTHTNAFHYYYYKKSTPPPPPPPGKADIIVYYKDKVSGAAVYPEDTTLMGVDYGTYIITALPAPANYTFDSVTTPSPQSVTVDAGNNYKEVVFYYQPNAAVFNKPPVAIINAPDMIYAGDNFYVSGKKSYDLDGNITEYLWDYDNDISGNVLGSNDAGYIWFPYKSSGLIKLQVKDNLGATGSEHKYVNILDPVPIAKIDVTGTLKVNRKVTVSALNSVEQDHYPIDHTRDNWTITADSSDLKYSGTLTGPTKDLLFKAAGDKPASLTVFNTYTDADYPNGFSDTDSTTLKIVPDQAPIANFSVPAVVTRNPSDNNNATITVTNTSSSPDGDIIGKAVLMSAYDSDNDNNFDEETWYYSTGGTTVINKNLLSNGDAEQSLTSGALKDWNTWASNSAATTFTKRTGDMWAINGTSFEIVTQPNSNYAASYLTTVPGIPGNSYSFTGKLSAHRSVGYFTIRAQNAAGTDLGWYNSAMVTNNTTPQNLTINFTAPAGTTKLIVQINKGNTSGYVAGFAEYVFADDLVLTNNTADRLQPVGMTYSQMATSFNIYNVTTSNPTNFIIKTDKVGKYKFELRVMEDIPDSQTIKSFLSESDFKRNDTFASKPMAEKIVDVRNVAPSVSFEAKKNIPMDLVVLTDYLGYKYDSLVSYINTKKAELLPLGINPTVSYITDRKTVGERTVYQYQWDRFIKLTVDGWANNVRGEFPYHNEFYFYLENLFFYEGEESFPDRSKYTYYTSTQVSDQEYPYSNGDPVWYLYVYVDAYYDGQYQRTMTTKFTLGRGQTFNGLGTWFTTGKPLNITVDNTYTKQFQKGGVSSSQRRAFQGLDVDKVMNVNTPSNNRYLLVAADSFWNTLEFNKLLKDSISSRNMSSYLVADNDTLNKVFTLSNFSDIRFINGLRAYEKDGKLYQYSGAVLQELPYAARAYPTPQSSVAVPMHDYTSKHWYSSKYDQSYSQVITNNRYTTTISIVNSSITVNGKVLNNVKSLYEIGDFYFAELYTGDIYYFKRYLNTWASSGVYLYYKTYISDFVQLSGAKGIKALKMIPALEYVDTWDIYNPKQNLNAEYFYIQDNNNNVYVAKSIGIYKSTMYASGEDILYLNYSDPTAVSDPTIVKSGAIDYNLTTTRVQDRYYDTWGTYRTVDRDVVNVEYALTNELSTVLKVDTDVNVYSTKELVPLINLFDGMKGGLYAAGNYQTAVDDITKDIKATTSTLTNYYLINEQINYSSIYSDYEGDAQYASRWWYTQDANYFDNSNGVEPNSGKYITTPINPFTKVGKYEITLQARDNPKNDLRFLNDTNEDSNYYKWSTVVDKLVLYVHRKPVALQRITVANNGNGTFTVKAFDAGSYDPDHSVTRPDKGIAAREWRWKESNETSWQYGQMNISNATADKTYITQLRVQDVEGAWSDYNTIQIDKDNPPVALFTLDNLIIKTNELLKVKDQSFPQSFSSITRWHWIVKNLNPDGSVPSTNLQNAIYSNSNNGTGTLTGYDVNVKTNYVAPGVGKYRIYLRVKDSNGLWSDGGTDSTTPVDLNKYYSQDFEVINPNLPPTIDIYDHIPKPIYIGDNVTLKMNIDDPDKDTLTLTTKLYNSANQLLATNDTILMPSGGVYSPSIVLSDVAGGTYRVVATVSDGYLTASDTYNFTVTDLDINANIIYNPAYAGERILLTADTSGQASEVVVDMGAVESGRTLQLTPDSPTTNDTNTWTNGTYIVPLTTDDGDYNVLFTVKRNTPNGVRSKTVMVVLKIRGNIYQLVKPRIIDSN